jgi:hypothetical protein
MSALPRAARYGMSLLGVACVLVVSVAPARAQSEDDIKKFAAYLALSVTPVAALPPFVTRSMAGGPVAVGGAPGAAGLRAQLALRYGRASFATDNPGEDTHVNGFAATGLIAAGEAATVQGTVGLLDPDCNDPNCDTEWMFGVGGDLALGGVALGADAGSGRVTLGLSGDFGYSKIEDVTSISLAAGVPIALVSGTGATKVVPFLTPAIGYGRTRIEVGEPERGAVRFLLGGGVSVLNLVNALSVSVGFQKIFFSLDTGFGTINSKTLFGLSATIGR